jgi:hypothetical protein
MMPLRIRRKGPALEKVEIPTASQRRKKSFQHDRTIPITLASACESLVYAIARRGGMVALSARLIEACPTALPTRQVQLGKGGNCSEYNACRI